MNDTAAILTRGLRKAYGRVVALDGLDLEVQKGEIFGFLGPNGAGKTTTIRCLLDLIHPSRGTVRVLGMDPHARSRAVREKTGYLPGELHLDQTMTVEQALRFFNQLRGSKTPWHEITALTERLDLDLKPPIRNLSRGSKQKVGVVQALMHHPPVLLLDEPTSGLDPLVQQQVLSLFREARAAGTTIFFSSHILSEVQELADRVAILREGRVVEVAAPQDLMARAWRQVTVTFKQPQDAHILTCVPGVELLGTSEGTVMRLRVKGEMDALLKALANLPVSDLETARPTLEEVFLTYYQGNQEDEQL